MPEPGAPESRGFFNVMRLVRATRYTARGLRHALGTDTSFRQEFVAALVLAPAGAWLGDTGVERALLVGALLLVLIVELVNAAVETVVDRVGAEFHELSGRAKDLSSAAVFISLVNVPVVWGLVLLG